VLAGHPEAISLATAVVRRRDHGAREHVRALEPRVALEQRRFVLLPTQDHQTILARV